MIRYDCFEWLAPQMTDQIVVTSLSGQRVEWGHLSKREADLNLGFHGQCARRGDRSCSGSAASKSFRVRVRRQRSALVVQSAHSGQPESAQHGGVRFRQPGLRGTRISYPSATAGKTDLAAIARGSGIEHSSR